MFIGEKSFSSLIGLKPIVNKYIGSQLLPSGVFDPLSLSGAVLWLDGSDNSTFTQSGNRVTQWWDKSDQSNHVSAVSNGPLANRRTINGEPAVYFDGTDSMNVGSTLIDMSTSDFSIFSVVQSDIHAATVPWSFANQFKIFDHSSSQWRINDGAGVTPDTLLGNAGTTGQPRMITIAGGSLSNDIVTYFDNTLDSSGAATFPATLNDFTIGAQFAGHTGSRLTGLIGEIIVYNRKLTSEEIAEVHQYLENKWKVGTQEITNMLVAAGGQSNISNWAAGTGIGVTNFETELNSKWNTSDWINGATSGSALLEVSGANGNQWLNADGTDGNAFNTWKTNVGSSKISASLWGQGERDGTDISSATERTNYKNGLITLFGRMHDHVGYEFPIIIQPLGRKNISGDNTGWQDVREIQLELEKEYPWIFVGPSVTHLDMQDNLHLTDASYGTVGTLFGRFLNWVLGRDVTGGVIGPFVSSVSTGSNSVTIDIEHENGADFTPVVDIEGFKFFDDGVEISVTSAVRTDADTITLSLASTPTGVETVYYQFRALDPPNLDHTNLVLDDSVNSLPLRSFVSIDGVIQ